MSRPLPSYLLHILWVACLAFSIIACRQQELKPIVFNPLDSAKHSPKTIVLKSGQDTLLYYQILTDSLDSLRSIKEYHYHALSHTVDTNYCEYIYEDKRLKRIHWEGLQDQGINGQDIPTVIDYEFEYDIAGVLVQVSYDQKSTFPIQLTATLLSQAVEGNRKVVLFDQGSHLTDTMTYAYNVDTQEKYIKINSFYDMIYKQSAVELHYKEGTGAWHLKARFCALKNPLYKTFWPLLQEFTKNNTNVRTQRHFSALCPDLRFFFSTFIQDSYTYCPVVYEGHHFAYIADPHVRLSSLRTLNESLSSELIFKYE